MPRRLNRITIIPPSPEDILINEPLTVDSASNKLNRESAIGFIAYHQNQPVNDFNIIKKQETLDLDWQDTWHSRFIDSELVRHDAIALASYLYIEPEEIRHYIILRVKELSDLLPAALSSREFINADEWDGFGKQIGEFLLGQNPLSVNGKVLTPDLDQTHFVDFDKSGGVKLLNKPQRLDFSQATIGIALLYKPDSVPEKVALQWQLFPGKVKTVTVAIYDSRGGTVVHELTPENNQLTWQNEISITRNVVKTLEVGESADYRLPVASIICLIILIPVAWWLSIRYRDDQPIHLQLVMAGLLLWAGGALAPYWQIAVPKPPGLAPVIGDQQATEILNNLLQNAYQAFEPPQDDKVRSRLALSVGGAALDKIYQLINQSLRLEQSDNNIRARIKQIDLVEDTVKPLAGIPLGLLFDARWSVSVIAGQWDDIYDRNIFYNALIEIKPVAGVWKITGINLLDQQTAQPDVNAKP
jgi:hypothetical protein